MGRTGKTILVAFTKQCDQHFDREAVRIINRVLVRVFGGNTLVKNTKLYLDMWFPGLVPFLT